MRVLTLVPHRVAPDRHAAIEVGRHPKPNYDALADAIRSLPGGVADILDHGAAQRANSLLVRAVRLIAGLNWALAVLGLQRCRNYDVVFSHAEAVSKPFALLLAFLPRRPRHVTLSNYVTGRRNMIWYRWLAIDRQMDVIVMHTKVQYETAVRRLAIPERKVLFLTSCGYVDVDFFQSTPPRAADSRLICAVGREFRDYATLFRAVAELPNVRLKIDGNSPWSVHQDQIKHLQIPPNVDVCSLEFGTVRNLYAESAIVAIPLLPNPIGAGFTTLVEAMAMGKAVIVTRSAEGTDRPQIADGVNVLMVDVGDVEGWKRAITRLLSDSGLRAQLGANARAWVEQHATRQQWLDTMIRVFKDVSRAQTIASPSMLALSDQQLHR